MHANFRDSVFALLAFLIFPGPVFGLDPASLQPGAGPCVIAIDPGHGGEDTGAVGPSGVAEKEVTLGVAKKLSVSLREKTGCSVVLTREDDTFVPLEERTALANRVSADIFISIHVNAALSRTVDGIETFFLSFDATDEDARRVAAFENSFSASGKTHTEVSGDLKEILLDMASTESHHESSALAEYVQTSLLKAVKREDRGVKQAPFTVLVGATMPAILVEVGFISNPREEMRLSSSAGQARLSDSITEGVIHFKKNNTQGKDYIGFNRPGKKE